MKTNMHTVLNREIEEWLGGKVDFIRFVDISALNFRQNRGMPRAVLIGIAVDPGFLQAVASNPDYAHTSDDEYARTESRAGATADGLAAFLAGRGYKALSQSDGGLLAENAFDFATKTSALPHKTIATLSGSGWIGKNNLFVTADYGAAQCLGSVLTDAPLSAAGHETQPSRCGGCTVCADICPEKALKGRNWSRALPRDEMINVYACDTCLKCLTHCPATRAYVRRALRE